MSRRHNRLTACSKQSRVVGSYSPLGKCLDVYTFLVGKVFQAVRLFSFCLISKCTSGNDKTDRY